MTPRDKRGDDDQVPEEFAGDELEMPEIIPYQLLISQRQQKLSELVKVESQCELSGDTKGAEACRLEREKLTDQINKLSHASAGG